MKEIEILIGPSGSGKSVYAHDMFLEYANEVVIVNRDKIRELLFGYIELNMPLYYLRKDLASLEKQVSIYEDTLIEIGLAQDKKVIIDATHLEKQYIERHFIWNVPTKLKFFDVDIKYCITRAALRTRSVAEPIIHSQFQKFAKVKKQFFDFTFIPYVLKNDINKPASIIFDIDGTLADHKGRRNPFDFSQVEQDDLIPFVAKAIDAHYNIGERIYIVSGREETCRKETVQWLKKHEIPYYDLFMRKEKDTRPDWQIKTELWEDITKHSYISQLYDDRAQVVRRARALGLNVNQVNYGYF